jgi:hypothetical protein
MVEATLSRWSTNPETGPSLLEPSRSAGPGTAKKAWQRPIEEARPSQRTESASRGREVSGLLIDILAALGKTLPWPLAALGRWRRHLVSHVLKARLLLGYAKLQQAHHPRLETDFKRAPSEFPRALLIVR